MPVIGAVLHFSDDKDERVRTRRLVEEDPRITVGPGRCDCVPLVLSTDSRAEDKAVWKRLESEPGVAFLSVVFADFSDVTEVSE